MKRYLRTLIPTATIAFAITACGGPDIDQVKNDFENPSGSAKDKNGVIAASGKQEAAGNNSALSLAGGGPPGVSGGLAVSGRENAFQRIAPMNVFGRMMTNVGYQRLGRSELRVAQTADDCFASEELVAAQQELQADYLADGKASASVSLSVDLESCGAGATGSLDLSMDMKIDGTMISYNVEYTFNDVCDTQSGDCVDGGMAQEAFLDIGMQDPMNPGNLFGQIKAVSAWDFTATYTDEDGKQASIASKGGLRIGYSSDGNGEQGSIEFLQYVIDSNGDEVSYVLKISANSATGEVSLEIRCEDGELICAFNDQTGSGNCSGTVDGQMFSVEWDDAEYDAVTEGEDFGG